MLMEFYNTNVPINDASFKTNDETNDVANNRRNVKRSVTQITQTPGEYYDALCNIKGDDYFKKGISFNEIVLRSLNYLFIECVDTSKLKAYTHWNLSFAKSILDKNTNFGYKPILETPSNINIEVYEKEYLKEAYFIIQLAYYLNEIDLKENQFFKYITHYFQTKTKLPDEVYKLDLEHLYKKYKDIDDGNINVAKNLLKKHFYGCLLIVLNELELPTTNFKNKVGFGRNYNAMSSSPKELRKYFPFELIEFDIQSANPHFIDMEIGSDVSNNIYDKVATAHNLTRTEAKKLFNKKLNSGKYYDRQHFYNFFSPIYQDKTNALIDLIKDEKRPLWKVMQNWEFLAIDTFKGTNKIYNGTRLHDAIYKINNEFLDVQKIEFNFYSFGKTTISNKSDELCFQVVKDKPSFSFISSLPENIKISELKTEVDTKQGFRYKGNSFDIYTRPFEYIKASFNIAHKGRFIGDNFVNISEGDFLKKCYNMVAVLRDLNLEVTRENLCYLINDIVNHIYKNSVYTFNKETLCRLMIEQIDNSELAPIVKIKDWYFKGVEGKNNITFYEFSSFLNEVRKEADLYFQANAILPIIEDAFRNGSRKFIKHSDLGIKSKRGNEFIYELINDFNMSNGFGYDVRFADSLNDFLKVVHEVCHNKYSKPIIVTDLVYRSSETAISQQFNIHRKTAKKIKSWFMFTPLSNRIETIYFTIKALAENTAKNVEIVKDQHRKLSVTNVTEHHQEKQILLTPDEAFNYDVDLSNSVLNIDETQALQRDESFYLDWFLFNYRNDYSEHQKNIIKTNKTALFNGEYQPILLIKNTA
jgi:hypothetical protein